MGQKLRVLGKPYKVKLVGPHQLADNDRVGECCTASKIIRIARGQTSENEADTRLHEAMHALWYEMNMHNSPAAEFEEYIVGALASGLTAVLLENEQTLPEFMRGET